MENKRIIDIEKRIQQYLDLNQLEKIEKDVVQVMHKLMNLFLLYIKNESLHYKTENSQTEFIKLKSQLIKFLTDNDYLSTEFKILEVDDFDNHLKYLKELLKNLCYYIEKYDFKIQSLNLYYYLFHLIYFILLAIIKSTDNNILKDDIVKFYIFHVVHFFINDKKFPEKYFFFYHGAFKILKKRYQIPTEFIMKLNTDKYYSTMSSTIKKIITDYRDKLVSEKTKVAEELNFLGKFSNIRDNIYKIADNISPYSDNIYQNLTPNDIDKIKDNTNIKNIFNYVVSQIDEIKIILNNNEITCAKLDKYKDLVKKFIDLISENQLTKNDLDLMELNYTNISNNKSYEFDIEKYIHYAELCNKCEKDSIEDYSDIFKVIINSIKFNSLYLTAMNSSFIKGFVEEKGLLNKYNLFMEKYAKNINKYILYVPLTRGIKAYVSNYLRIALNINSIEIFGEFDKNSKMDFISSYLLIQLLHESFHFLFRLGKEGEIASNEEVLSPLSKKIKEVYKEIGVDLILSVFGTEYILFISKKNCDLLCDPNSWNNNDTNFKVFNKVYLSFCELVDEKDKEKNFDSGLKCNISVDNEFIGNDDYKICTDSVIRYCF